MRRTATLRAVGIAAALATAGGGIAQAHHLPEHVKQIPPGQILEKPPPAPETPTVPEPPPVEVPTVPEPPPPEEVVPPETVPAPPPVESAPVPTVESPAAPVPAPSGATDGVAGSAPRAPSYTRRGGIGGARAPASQPSGAPPVAASPDPIWSPASSSLPVRASGAWARPTGAAALLANATDGFDTPAARLFDPAGALAARDRAGSALGAASPLSGVKGVSASSDPRPSSDGGGASGPPDDRAIYLAMLLVTAAIAGLALTARRELHR